ncbi:arylsulfatase [Roseibacillus ishigakijimensis]|uniref:Arylsulfatase n=1 Tax=Roseibacillus ishigakijimensis TaxID=454146 RepID=A0A934VN63_9BACT|nr:arylsulfatase [Roseibacillus ishigakijimensis]MBK1834695.1 arylsulfatase [Roseibacillus ishigakijimensis]
MIRLFLVFAVLLGYARGEKPNIVFILADDLGYSDLGCYGGPVATPHLDGLAVNGVRFTQFYNTARCWPTRAALMTGYHFVQVGKQARGYRMLPHFLAEQGYRSYHSGKWHVMGAKPVADAGFDRSFWTNNYDRFFDQRDNLLDDKPLPDRGRVPGYYVTREIASRAEVFLREHEENHGGQPFFLYLAFTSPHFPLQALPEDIARYRGRFSHGWDEERQKRLARLAELGFPAVEPAPRDEEVAPKWSLPEGTLKEQVHPGERRYAVPWESLSKEEKDYHATKMAIHCAMIDRMDQEIGRLLAQLRESGRLANTLILFCSDNGASGEQLNRGDQHTAGAELGSAESYLCLGPGWSMAANTPFRLHKHWTHEGGIATPLIAHWPQGLAGKGSLQATPGHVVDLLPTLVEVAGGKVPESAQAPYPGVSWGKHLRGEQISDEREIYWNHQENHALRVGDWKVVRTPYLGGEWQLYYLAEDRGETTDLAAREPERVERLVARWETLTAQYQRAGRRED